jgi:hypothetical protein
MQCSNLRFKRASLQQFATAMFFSNYYHFLIFYNDIATMYKEERMACNARFTANIDITTKHDTTLRDKVWQ